MIHEAHGKDLLHFRTKAKSWDPSLDYLLSQRSNDSYQSLRNNPMPVIQTTADDQH